MEVPMVQTIHATTYNGGWRFMLLIGSGLFFAIAIIIISANIPEKGLMAGGHIVVGVLLLAIAFGAQSPSTGRRVLAGLGGLLALSWVPGVLYTGIFRWHDPARTRQVAQSSIPPDEQSVALLEEQYDDG
jgi:hypothetical protein